MTQSGLIIAFVDWTKLADQGERLNTETTREANSMVRQPEKLRTVDVVIGLVVIGFLGPILYKAFQARPTSDLVWWAFIFFLALLLTLRFRYSGRKAWLGFVAGITVSFAIIFIVGAIIGIRSRQIIANIEFEEAVQLESSYMKGMITEDREFVRITHEDGLVEYHLKLWDLDIKKSNSQAIEALRETERNAAINSHCDNSRIVAYTLGEIGELRYRFVDQNDELAVEFTIADQDCLPVNLYR